MNGRQRTILTVAAGVILVMILFPPWIFVFEPSAELRPTFVKAERPAGYHFLLSDHSPQDQSQLTSMFGLVSPHPYQWELITLNLFSVRLDLARLTVQILGAGLVTAILYLAARSNPRT